MKVLHLSGSVHHWSGNEQQLSDLIDNLNRIDVESAIFCYEDSAIEHYALSHSIKVYSYPKQSIYSPLFAKALKACIWNNSIDIVHIHTSNFLTLCVISDLLFSIRKPMVFSRKGFTRRAGWLSRYKYNYKGIRRVICVSQAVQRDFAQYLTSQSQTKLRVIYDGINIDHHVQGTERNNLSNLREQLSISPTTSVIGNIANHVKDKDLPTLIKAMNYLVHTLGRKDIHLIQIGAHTPLTPSLIQMIDEYRLNPYITLMGKVPEASLYMPQFDLFVMSSQSEGLPLTIYEAFLYQKAVVTTDAGGIPEAVVNNKTGLIVKVGDSQHLAQSMSLLLDDTALKEQVVKNAYQQLYDHFTALHCAKQTKALYEECL